MGYHLNRLDEPVFMAGPKPMRTDFGIPQLAICIASAILGIISLKMGAMYTQKHKKLKKIILKILTSGLYGPTAFGLATSATLLKFCMLSGLC